MVLCRLYVLLGAMVLLIVEAPAQLPPEIQADRYLVEAERHIGTGDHAAAQAALDRILTLQADHDLALPEAFWFQYAQVAYQAGRSAAAVEAATRYLTTVGREGAHYREALEHPVNRLNRGRRFKPASSCGTLLVEDAKRGATDGPRLFPRLT